MWLSVKLQRFQPCALPWPLKAPNVSFPLPHVEAMFQCRKLTERCCIGTWLHLSVPDVKEMEGNGTDATAVKNLRRENNGY